MGFFFYKMIVIELKDWINQKFIKIIVSIFLLSIKKEKTIVKLLLEMKKCEF